MCLLQCWKMVSFAIMMLGSGECQLWIWKCFTSCVVGANFLDQKCYQCYNFRFLQLCLSFAIVMLGSGRRVPAVKGPFGRLGTIRGSTVGLPHLPPSPPLSHCNCKCQPTFESKNRKPILTIHTFLGGWGLSEAPQWVFPTSLPLPLSPSHCKCQPTLNQKAHGSHWLTLYINIFKLSVVLLILPQLPVRDKSISIFFDKFLPNNNPIHLQNMLLLRTWCKSI